MKRHKARTPYYPRCRSTLKVRYPTMTAANTARTILTNSGKANKPLRTYYCTNCIGFHLGTNTDNDS